MTQYIVALEPYNQPPFLLSCFDHWDGDFLTNQLSSRATPPALHFDWTYTLFLSDQQRQDLLSVTCYINDDLIPCVYRNGEITFSQPRIFLEYFGFVQFALVLTYADGTRLRLYSDYLPILVKDQPMNQSIRSMVDYVQNHQSDLLLQSDHKARDLSGLQENAPQTLSSQLLLIQEITQLYENSYGYFRANARFQVEKEDVVQRLERVQYITPKTLQYTLQHPEQLTRVSGTTGIRAGNRIYHPQRTMTTQSVYSRDTYENRIILGFLRTLLSQTQTLKDKVSNLLQTLPGTGSPPGGLVYSHLFLLSGTQRFLEESLHQLDQAQRKLQALWGLYRQIFPFERSAPLLTQPPKPSAIFRAVPQYNQMFLAVYRWYHFGLYDLSQETYMLSFLRLPVLYETYLVAKFVHSLQELGWSLDSASRYQYLGLNPTHYSNTTCNNTFHFSQDSGESLTFYYQPVVYAGHRSQCGSNGIGLYRNTSLSLGDGTGGFYTPDFLLKYTGTQGSRYLLADAKFSSLTTVKTHQVPSLAYKYLFSMTPLDAKDRMVGLTILYGQCTDQDVFASVYDRQPQGAPPIFPFANLLPMLEGVENTTHTPNIQALIRLMGQC